MPLQLRLAAILPRFYLGTALSFAVLAAAFASVVLWSNATRYDRSLLAFVVAVLGLVAGLAGFFAVLLGYRLTRGQTFNRAEWRTGSFLFAGALLAAIAAVIATKCAFPELPE